MLARLARIADKTYVKVALICMWIPLTFWLGALPLAFSLGAIINGHELVTASISSALVLWSLAAVWTRILASSQMLQRSKIFWPTALGLAVGIVEIGAILVMLGTSARNLSEPYFWAFLTTQLLAILLLGATVGARTLPSNGVGSHARSLDAA